MLADSLGLDISKEHVAFMLIPNGAKALSAYVWMKEIFQLIADVQPNKDEVHLEAMGDSYYYSSLFVITDSYR